MTTNVIKWKKDGKWYRSSCGRFVVMQTSLTTRPFWTLVDNELRDADSSYKWMRPCTSLSSAKRFAEKVIGSK